MALSAFDDKSEKPRPVALQRVLGRTSAHWDNLTTHIAAEYPPVDEAWNFAGTKWGWSLRLKHKKRTIFYLTPCKGHFLVGLVLGERAVKAARAERLSDSLLTVIHQAKKYAEGRAVRIEIKSKKDVEIAKKLAAIKMKN